MSSSSSSTESSTATLKGNKIIGIRRETKNRWERRVALTPDNVRELVNTHGLKVIVQPSKMRIFADTEYEEAGAVIDEDLSPAALIVAVKEVPADVIIPNRNYIFFSHIIKAQPYNMPLMDVMLRKNIRLFDYERIRDNNGQRLVRFGQYAGRAGSIDGLSFVGNRLLAQGVQTPFLQVAPAYTYDSVADAKDAVAQVGKQIANVGLDDSLVPFVITITGGKGQCATGARDVLYSLPVQEVTVDELPALFEPGAASNKVVYVCNLSSRDWVQHVDGSSPFDRKEFYEHGAKRYRSIFAEQIAPYTTVLINGMYWEEHQPRLLSIAETKDLRDAGKLRLQFDIDVSCDIGGSVEWMLDSTSIDDPFFIYDLDTGNTSNDIYAKGLFVLAIDNLPCELAREASEFFGTHLMPFIPEMAVADGSVPFDQQTDICDEVRNSILLTHGQLTPGFKYIADMRRANEEKFKKVLLLGAGMVTPPLVRHMMDAGNYIVTVASLFLDEAVALCGGHPRCTPIRCDSTKDDELLDQLVSESDMVISLLPAHLHPPVAKLCVRHKKDMVNASYISDEMRALEADIAEAGITVLCEMGLDPGLDHMLARNLIDMVHNDLDAKVVSLESYCGGLPAPEDNNNALGYKFSWSPAGALRSMHRDAVYRIDGLTAKVNGKLLYSHSLGEIPYCPGYNVEAVPNHNSLYFAKEYGVLSEASTFVRGTLRYKGYFQTMHAIDKLGLISHDENHLLASGKDITWHQLVADLVYIDEGSDVSLEHVCRAVAATLIGQGFSQTKARQAVSKMMTLGLLSTQLVPKSGTSPFDVVVDWLSEKLAYEDGEKDLVLLIVSVIAETQDGTQTRYTSQLVEYGDDNASAMARTVGIPVGCAVDAIASGELAGKGLVTPSESSVCKALTLRIEHAGVVPTTESEPILLW